MATTPSTPVRQEPTQQVPRRSLVDRVVEFFSRLVARYLPDPMTIAILITVATLVLAVVVQRVSITDAVRYWGDGFWDLLAFTMQMAAILITGYLLARAPIVDRLLDRLALWIPSPRTAIIAATLVGTVGSYVNWGFGLVAGSLVAQKLALHVRGLHYPLAIAAAYSGFCMYGVGVSGSIPLTVATPGHFLEDAMGVIPTSETSFSGPLLTMSILVMVTMPLFNAWLHPKNPKDVVEIDPATVPAVSAPPGVDATTTVGERINRSRWIVVVIGGLAIAYLGIYIADGGSVNLNTVNFAFLFLGILLMGSVSRFVSVVGDAAKVAAGVIIQYPFYAGIMAILVGSGLVVSFAEMFVGISTAESLPFWSFLSAGIINIAMPSGGGQWAVQGPVMVEAANALGASLPQVSMAVALGDQWTNAIQPFWILPVLAISKLKLKDVMGYLVVILGYLTVVFGATVLAWSYLG